jgi:hypothetical protein
MMQASMSLMERAEQSFQTPRRIGAVRQAPLYENSRVGIADDLSC